MKLKKGVAAVHTNSQNVAHIKDVWQQLTRNLITGVVSDFGVSGAHAGRGGEKISNQSSYK